MLGCENRGGVKHRILGEHVIEFVGLAVLDDAQPLVYH
jgi:hypothetical protein